MHVVIAGATGVIGRQLVPLLRARGVDLTLVRRRPSAPDPTMRTVCVDVLDRGALARAWSAAAPPKVHAVVNLLTAIPPVLHPRRTKQELARTNQLRVQGLTNLLDVCGRPHRVISQSLAYAYDPDLAAEHPVAVETDPLWRDPPAAWRPSRDAILELEAITNDHGGQILRMGHIYGPGTHFGIDGSVTDQIGRHAYPIIGGGGAVHSFIHTQDAARAVLSALEYNIPGSFNVVDDNPVLVRDWLPLLADRIDARPPGRIPAGVARRIAGQWAVAFNTRLKGASNSKITQTLGWRPLYASLSDGLDADNSGHRRT